MFDIKPEARMDLKERLLYNIWQELKLLNGNSGSVVEKETAENKDIPKIDESLQRKNKKG